MIVFLLSEVLTSQVSINVNIGTPAPRYYYLDDIESYYDIQESQYIFLSGGRWIHARRLPASFGYYNMNTRHKVIIKDYRGNSPNIYYREHRIKYPKGTHKGAGKSYWSANDNKRQVRQNTNASQNFKGDNNSHYKDNNSRYNDNKGNGGGRGKGQGRGNKK